jgi:hypothetical protein
MLNVDLRPVTAKWHRSHEAGLLNSRDGANEFRADLAAVRTKLAAFSQTLQLMAYGTSVPDEVTPPVISHAEIGQCFEAVKFGIDADTSGRITNVEDINRSEETEVPARRATYRIERPTHANAIGLALSGGGIRSATFCLGVIQVLAARGLMGDFDYLSTVSGGCYTGSFITSQLGAGRTYGDIGQPHGPDTDPVRHLRQNAKYLSALDLKERWLMVTGTMAGLLLNWTAPLCVLAAAALVSNFAAMELTPELWLSIAAALGGVTAVAMLVYGIALRLGFGARMGGLLLAAGAGLSLVSLAIYGIERGYVLFADPLNLHWSISGVSAALVVTAPAMVRFLPLFRTPAAKKSAFKVVLLAAGVVVPLLAVASFYLLRVLGSLPFNATAPVWNPLHFVSGTYLLGLIAVASGLFALLLLNINLTGPHKLYRDHLAKTFIRMSNPPLSKVNATEVAPYHLINTTLNLPSSTSPVLGDRKGDFFLFSKCWSGAPAVGYLPKNGRPREWRSTLRPPWQYQVRQHLRTWGLNRCLVSRRCLPC